ncbi:MAG: hypothetical protein LBE25_03885 [Arthrobacter sp.]|jgi:hypothetical protein|nr:hypothetical protein [Arthrobacter sp.]
MGPILLMALGGLLAGGAFSLKKQGAGLTWVIACSALAVMSLVAAWALTYKL